ncbi:hypothetical protein GCM10011414_07000 [Croceivirga lutea]|uniref:gluconate 2-dehydrogenase subunit 3 family protein n=1 Tax=Croceivirga lutea TaxID=1775167 RepID=UPI00163AB522|nr:gluconate 2-dehydrogenase subunit 3 family protein [Croceivirga lutea]GGG40107.1 hypothetical protein GCM10011414_07000 [Croceivirga lutea]
MERRSALKKIGLSFGYAVAAPTLLSVLQSCESKAAYADWTPAFFEKEKGYALAQTLDVILPKTDTPSATELNVHVFIDSFMKEVMPEEQQNLVKKNMDAFFNKVKADADLESLMDVKAEHITPLLDTYLKKRDDETEKMHSESISNYMQAIMAGGEADLDEDISRFSFANDVRDLATWAYKNTEFIGEEVLAYSSIPGEYIACGDAQELTQGKAWSL